MDAKPEILNHNTETVPRLYRTVRPQAQYWRSLELLQRAKAMDALALTKTGIMVGLGETWEEILRVLDDMRAHDVDIVTIGQYLQPSRFHLPIERYYTPDEFDQLAAEGEERGFRWVESGPLVRSSYHADGQAHGGSGVIVLPCGAGKTMVGMAAMEKLQSATLILTPSTVAARQWKAELLDKTDLREEDIGEYTGLVKEIKPVTIATYQILVYRQARNKPFTHFELFNQYGPSRASIGS